MKENKGLSINVGSASIMLVLLVFILSTFGVLSIKASNNELRLAQKTGISVKEYYEADSKAQKVLAEINGILNDTNNNQVVETIKNIKMDGLKEIQVKSIELEEPIVVIEGEETGTEANSTIQDIVSIAYQIAMRGESVLSVTLEPDETRNFQITSWKAIPEQMDDYNMGFEIDNLWDGQIDVEEE